MAMQAAKNMDDLREQELPGVSTAAGAGIVRSAGVPRCGQPHPYGRRRYHALTSGVTASSGTKLTGIRTYHGSGESAIRMPAANANTDAYLIVLLTRSFASSGGGSLT
jgi:hypothetical protein